MELKELTVKTLDLFEVDDVSKLGNALWKAIESDDVNKYASFSDMIDNDMSKDWLQMIYQYYLADREKKKQDYTPACLAKFLSRLIGDSTETIDMCTGSGALSIQRWNENHDNSFILYEIDENVIPFLVFNMVIRNITATINQTDILQDETINTWKVSRGDRFGKVINIKSALQS